MFKQAVGSGFGPVTAGMNEILGNQMGIAFTLLA